MSHLDRDTAWFTCECCSHVISVLDCNTNPDPWPFVEVALWGRYPRQGLWGRIRDAWQALKGDLYRDNICLDHETANRLGYHLIAVANPHHGYGCPRDGEPRVGDCEECEKAQKALDALPSFDP